MKLLKLLGLLVVFTIGFIGFTQAQTLTPHYQERGVHSLTSLQHQPLTFTESNSHCEEIVVVLPYPLEWMEELIISYTHHHYLWSGVAQPHDLHIHIETIPAYHLLNYTHIQTDNGIDSDEQVVIQNLGLKAGEGSESLKYQHIKVNCANSFDYFGYTDIKGITFKLLPTANRPAAPTHPPAVPVTPPPQGNSETPVPSETPTENAGEEGGE